VESWAKSWRGDGCSAECRHGWCDTGTVRENASFATAGVFTSDAEEAYLSVFFQSSTHHGHQLLGFPCVVPFLITLIFIIALSFLVLDRDRVYLNWSRGTSTSHGRTTPVLILVLLGFLLGASSFIVRSPWMCARVLIVIPFVLGPCWPAKACGFIGDCGQPGFEAGLVTGRFGHVATLVM